MSDIVMTRLGDKVQFTVVLGSLGGADKCDVIVDDSFTSNDDVIWSDDITTTTVNIGVEVHCTIALDPSLLVGVESIYVQAYKRLTFLNQPLPSIKYNPFVVAVPPEVSSV